MSGKQKPLFLKAPLVAEGEKGGNRVFLNVSKIWRVAAAITILVIGTFMVFYLVPSKTVQLVALETPQTHTIFGSADVTLFPGATISYHKTSKNEVHLKGKATFIIDATTPTGILVQAGETYIKDIGTVFTVDAATPDISITVEVTEGEVWFYTEINAGVYVKANESAIYDAQTKQFRMIESVEAWRAIPAPEIIFQNTTFHEAIEFIKTRYNVDINIISKELNEILLNVSFDDNASVDYVLEIIAATISAQLHKKGDSYFFE